jgi:ubiquinone/menaquinone biosynthesis C-methylase UbiE
MHGYKTYALYLVTIVTNLLLCNSACANGTAKPITINNDDELTAAIVHGWDAISPAYLDHKSNQVHPGDLIEAPVFQELIKKYAHHAHMVLDAATGNGWFTISLLKWDILAQLTRIIGIDASKAMIATARAQCPDHRAEFVCGSLDSDIYQAIGIDKESVDLVISSNALDCVKNIDQTLTKLYQVLKPGCYAIISIRHPLRNAYYLTGDIQENFVEGAYAEQWRGTAGHEVIRFYRKEHTWDMLFKKYGFEIVEKNVPVISDSAAQTYPEHYLYYKNKKHPGALIYVLRRAA